MLQTSYLDFWAHETKQTESASREQAPTVVCEQTACSSQTLQSFQLTQWEIQLIKSFLSAICRQNIHYFNDNLGFPSLKEKKSTHSCIQNFKCELHQRAKFWARSGAISRIPPQICFLRDMPQLSSAVRLSVSIGCDHSWACVFSISQWPCGV